jgi:hypothetical protein
MAGFAATATEAETVPATQPLSRLQTDDNPGRENVLIFSSLLGI